MSYTIKLKSTSIQMGRTTTVNKIVNPTASNSSDFNLVSLNVSNNLNLKYCDVVGVLHTDVTGNVITKLIDTSDFNPLSITTAKLADASVTTAKLADSIFLSGIPTAPTASEGTNSTQLATTEFVQTACSKILGFAPETLNSLTELATAIGDDPNFSANITTSVSSKVSLADNDVITGVKTFNTLPVLVPLSSVGIVHNDASGKLSTNLIQTVDINDASITFAKLDANLVLPFNTTLDVTSVNTDSKAIVTKGFLAASIKPFTDTLSNVQPVSPIGFFHVNETNISLDINSVSVFTLSNNIRHIIDVSTKILLPAISALGGIPVEGIFYSIINKSGDVIVISTASVGELIFNAFVAPDGDNDFNLGPNQCLEFISIVSNGISSWQAQYY
jgi:hypothetical protein